MRKYILFLLSVLLLFGCTPKPTEQRTEPVENPALVTDDIAVEPSPKQEEQAPPKEVPEEITQPIEETSPEIPKTTCTFSISCQNLLDNLEKLDADKHELVPQNGWILPPETVEIVEGESVFDLLKRICRDQGIPMEHSFAPIYNSAYIEGIGNLYELDAGPTSGWIYSVNGESPNYGCSSYHLKAGDVVCWEYCVD